MNCSLFFENLCIRNKDSIITLNYKFLPGNCYIIHSDDQEALNNISKFLIYPESIRYGKIKFYNLDMKNYDPDNYRKYILSTVFDVNNLIDCLSSFDFLNLFTKKEEESLKALFFLEFPENKINIKISKLSLEEKRKVVFAKLLVRQTSINLLNFFFDNLDEKERLIYIDKLFQFNLSEDNIIIILSNCSKWDTNNFTILNF